MVSQKSFNLNFLSEFSSALLYTLYTCCMHSEDYVQIALYFSAIFKGNLLSCRNSEGKDIWHHFSHDCMVWANGCYTDLCHPNSIKMIFAQTSQTMKCEKHFLKSKKQLFFRSNDFLRGTADWAKKADYLSMSVKIRIHGQRFDFTLF